MRASNILTPTLRDTPADAEVTSHVLLLRAGLIRQLASGLYTWLPLGLNVLRKLESIIREELTRAGAQEILMPVVQPADLWRESGRWDVMGPEMMRMVDRNQRDYCLSPTHEEVVTDLVRKVVVSYKQLPCNLYQINTKFRDEIRPRFGVMRAREFLMKDGYSFHLDEDSFDRTYHAMFDAYCAILERVGLKYRAVEADPGTMGDGDSHEFHVLAECGEDAIAYSPASDYAANVERAEAVALGERSAAGAQMQKHPTPGAKTIAEVARLFAVDADHTVKTLIVKGVDDALVALVVRGDHELNEAKAARLDAVATPLEFAPEADIRAAIGCGPGSIGPVGLPIPVLVDRSADTLSDFICGANEDDHHFVDANWDRDATPLAVVDIRNVNEGEPAADGSGALEFMRGIEVGHIFKLGTKYTESMGVTVQDKDGTATPLIMGCYGMGVTRLVAAVVEQCHDDDGIVWPASVAPAQLHIVAVNNTRSEAVAQAAETLYLQCTQAGIETYLDDRDERPGVKFADADLIGIPNRVTVGDRNLANGVVEFKTRQTDVELIAPDEVVGRLKA